MAVRSTSHERRGRIIRIGVATAVGALLVLVYLASVHAYRLGLDEEFATPDTIPDGVAVTVVPTSVDADRQLISAEVLIFPGENLLTPEERLTRDISLDIYPSAESGTVTFLKDTIPSPQQVEIPALGVVQRYPFDVYRVTVEVNTVLEPKTATQVADTPIPMSLSQFFKVPGWGFTTTTVDSEFSETGHRLEGEVGRSGTTITIAVIFIVLILMFGVLSVITVISGIRSQLDLAIGTAAWLTTAIFALVALRNGLPGNPPLGSWMDILVYFWVVAVIMMMIGLTVITLVTRARRQAREAAAPPKQDGYPPVGTTPNSAP